MAVARATRKTQDFAILNTAVPPDLKLWLMEEAARCDRSLTNLVRLILQDARERRARAACEETTP